MNAETLALIKVECEKIEAKPGFGKVLISIEDGKVSVIQPTPTILLRALDKVNKQVIISR